MRVFTLIFFLFAASLGSAMGHGDAMQHGKELAQACIACHTPTGEGTAPAFPNIGGQGYRYLYEQLEAIRSGARAVPEMAGQLDNLTKHDLQSLATYYSKQNAATGSTDPDLLKLGRRIYMGGDHQRNIPACAACHSPSGSGMPAAAFPSLKGQSAQYIAKTLRDYRHQRRMGDENRIMITISARLTEAEVDALASYVSGLRLR